MKIPYRHQITDVSCGAAVVEMVLKHCGIIRSQKEIIQLLQFDDHGATNTSLRRLLESLRIPCQVYAQQSQDKESHIPVLPTNALPQLMKHLDAGNLVILNYLSEDGETGHYVLVHSHDNEYLIVNDPDPVRGGPSVVLQQDYLEQRWISGDKKWQKWFLVIDVPSKKKAGPGRSRATF